MSLPQCSGIEATGCTVCGSTLGRCGGPGELLGNSGRVVLALSAGWIVVRITLPAELRSA